MTDLTIRRADFIPSPGFGTWRIGDTDAEASVELAIRTGYRHIDTAAYYGNETGVGKGVASSGIARKDLFVVSKVWVDHRSRDGAIASCEETLARMGLSYLDMLLIHWPADPAKEPRWREVNADTWRGLMALRESGKVRHIGVSNFQPVHLQVLTEDTDCPPEANQIEFHPGFRQAECVTYCLQNDIRLEAWSPLGRGEVLNHPTIVKMAKEYGVTPARLTIRWVRQSGLVPIVKSVNPERMRENLGDMRPLAAGDMALLNALPFFGRLGYSPDKVRF